MSLPACARHMKVRMPPSTSRRVGRLAVLMLLAGCDAVTQPDFGGNKPLGPSPFSPAPPAPGPDVPAPIGPVHPANPPPLPPGPPGLYVADASGANPRLLVEGEWPAWSPDGTRIAFQRGGSIHVIDVTGSGERAIAAGVEPAWSPDGRRLALAAAEGIVTMLEDGSERTVVVRHEFRDDTWAEGDMGVGAPAWSPDGSSIAFGHRGDGDMTPAQVFVVDLAGGSPIRLTERRGIQYAESNPSWTPDGGAILFWSYGYGVASATVGGSVTSLYLNFPAVAYGSKPVSSPDGRTILVSAGQFTTGPELWTQGPDGMVRRLVSAARHGVYSPDGTRIAFVRTQ